MNKLYVYGLSAITVIAGLYYASTLSAQSANEKPISQTVMPTLDQTFDHGRQLYASNCSGCHGTTLGGVVGNGPPLVHAYYHSGHHGDESFYRAVANGVQAHHWRFGDMPKIESLGRSDVRQIIKFVRTVQSANGLP